MSGQFDDELRTWATVRELEYIDAIQKHGGKVKAAARTLGVRAQTIDGALNRLRVRAALKGYSPDHNLTHPVPDGFKLKGASQLWRDGKLVLEWVKSTADTERQEAIIREAFAAMSEDVKRVKPIPAPKHVLADLINVYTLTDSHVGALAWHRENLEDDWDLQIAEKTLVESFAHMIHASPAAGTCVVAQLGDFLHSDGLKAVTPTSGHLLDQDGRFGKVVRAAIRILRAVVDMALCRHQKVIVIMAEGNHDMASSVWLRIMFAALYEKEPRVQVIDSELPYYVHQHGKVMLAWHHGHLKKNDDLPLLFASQFPVVWGATTKRYAHTGHRHHVEEKEHSGMTVIQHPTLAARDAYAARGGWLSMRQCTSITYHVAYGQVGRNTVCPEMLAA